jgi:hypothetical protein
MKGHVYILLNASIPGLLKIGMTARAPEERARELSQGTGVPAPFSVAYSEEVPDCQAAEALIHARLAPFRVQGSGILQSASPRRDSRIGSDCDRFKALVRHRDIHGTVR